MPQSVAEVLDLLDLDECGPNTFLGRQPRRTELEKVYGGQVVAQSLVAASRTVAPDRLPHSVHGQFLRGGDTTAPIRFEVETLRDGGSFSSRHVRAMQHDQLIFHLTASFHIKEIGFEHATPAPIVPSFDDVPSLADAMERTNPPAASVWRREWGGLDMRYVGDNRPAELSSAVPSVQRVWIRYQESFPDDPRLHAFMLAYLSDLGLLAASLAPHGYLIWAPGVPRASLDHSVWFHGPVRADGWMLFDQSSSWAGGARGLSDGRIYHESGRLCASLAQEGLIRPRDEVRRRIEAASSAAVSATG